MINNVIRKFRWNNIFAVLIVLIALTFRFYNIHNWIFFGMDQEYEALLVKNILTGRHFPLIGVNASDTGLYLGPAFIYSASIPFLLFSGDPFGWALSASILSLVVCFLVFHIGKKMFNREVGIFSMIIYASSLLVSFYDRQFWNPTPIPFFSLTSGYLLFKVMKGKVKNLIWLSVTYGLAVQCHLSILIFLPLIIYIIFSQRKHLSRKIVIISLSIFLLLQSPIILFEFRHSFTNTKALYRILIQKDNKDIKHSSITNRFNIGLSSLGRFLYIPLSSDFFLESGQCEELVKYRNNGNPLSKLIMLTSLGILIWSVTNFNRLSRKLSLDCHTYLSLILIVWLFTLTGLFIIFYDRGVFEYYFLYLFPWLALTLGWSLFVVWSKPYGKYIVIPFTCFFIINNLLSLFTSSFSFSYKDKKNVLSYVKNELKGDNYDLEAIGDCARFGGYRYLFERFVGVPAHSYMDSYFSWLYYDNSIQLPSRIVLLSLIDYRNNKEIVSFWETKKLEYLSQSNMIAKQKFGDIQVFILSRSITDEENNK